MTVARLGAVGVKKQRSMAFGRTRLATEFRSL